MDREVFLKNKTAEIYNDKVNSGLSVFGIYGATRILKTIEMLVIRLNMYRWIQSCKISPLGDKNISGFQGYQQTCRKGSEEYQPKETPFADLIKRQYDLSV